MLQWTVKSFFSTTQEYLPLKTAWGECLASQLAACSSAHQILVAYYATRAPTNNHAMKCIPNKTNPAVKGKGTQIKTALQLIGT